MTDLIIVTDPGASGNGDRPDGASASSRPMVQEAQQPIAQQPLLSSSVPEPMSYSGRNYITLDLPTEAFAVPQIDPAMIQVSPAPAPAGMTASPSKPQLAAQGSEGAADPADDGSTSASNSIGVPLSAEAVIERASRFGQLPVTHAALGNRLISTMPMGDPGGGIVLDPPTVSVTIDSPDDGAEVSGTAQGVTVPVTGRWSAQAYTGSPTITISADDAPPSAVTLGAGTWSASVTLKTAGRHVLKAVAQVDGATWRGKQLSALDTASRAITATLTTVDGPPPALPAIVVKDPFPGKVLAAPGGETKVTVIGTVSPTPCTVTVTDTVTQVQASAQIESGKTDFSLDITLTGLGAHTLNVIAAVSPQSVSGATIIPVTLDNRPPTVRVLNKLMIVETLNLTAYLGAYGLGRCLKTMSLLAGESTTISLKSFSSNTETAKTASSILDSSTQEATDDFKTAISSEQTDTDSEKRAQQFTVSGKASASWGFAQASIDASYSGSANSAREEAVKRVSNATRDHAMRASANRSVTVNTENASTLTTTQDDSTIRTISNINVGRTLNYVFTQMNQEHIVLYHLTDARLAFYTEDLALGSDGKPAKDANGNYLITPNYQEVSLPELGSLLAGVLNPKKIDPTKVTQAVINALSGIPDYTDTLQTLVETAVPADSAGNQVPSASYLRVVRNLHTDFKDPYSDFTIRVPGIVLSFDHIVQRTDGVFVEAILGQGDALDTYSHGLQDAAVAAKQADAGKRKLALDLITGHDDPGATIYQKVFPATAQPAPSGSGG